jgi:methyl-accepting chemotaxis protein
MLKRNRPYANEAQMSMSTAEKYARRARNSADSLEDVAYNIACAIDALVQAIRDLEARVKRLESKMR